MSLDSMDITVADVDEFWYGKFPLEEFLLRERERTIFSYRQRPGLVLISLIWCRFDVRSGRIGRDPHSPGSDLVGHPGQHLAYGHLPLFQLTRSVYLGPMSPVPDHLGLVVLMPNSLTLR